MHKRRHFFIIPNVPLLVPITVESLKWPFFRADMAGLGKYHMGGYGRIGVYRVNQEICGQKQNLYAIFWKNFTFMKFCGDYYDIHEKKIIFY